MRSSGKCVYVCVLALISVYAHAVFSAWQYFSPHLLMWSPANSSRSLFLPPFLCYTSAFAVVTSNFSFNSLHLPLLQLVQTLSHTHVGVQTHTQSRCQRYGSLDWGRIGFLREYWRLFIFICSLIFTSSSFHPTLSVLSLFYSLSPTFASLSLSLSHTLFSPYHILPFSLRPLALLSFGPLSLCLCCSHSLQVRLFSPHLHLSSCTVS